MISDLRSSSRLLATHPYQYNAGEERYVQENWELSENLIIYKMFVKTFDTSFNSTEFALEVVFS